MESLLLAIETLTYFFGMQLLLNQVYIRAGKYRLKIITALLFRVAILLTTIPMGDLAAVALLFVTIFDMVLIRLSFVGLKRKTVVVLYALFYSVYTMVSCILTFLVSQYTQLSLLSFIGVVSGLFVVLLCVCVVRIKPGIFVTLSLIPRRIKRICTLSVLSSSAILYLLLYVSNFNKVEQWRATSKISLVLFVIVVGSIFPAIVVSSLGTVYHNKRASELEKQIELQAKHYEEMAQNTLDLRRFKHDYKNLLLGVRELVQEGDAQGALELLDRESGALPEGLQPHFETGNGIVDAILYEKQKRAEAVNTVIEFEGSVPVAKIAPTDLCVIFGNTLDNAIEACEEVQFEEKNVIAVSCRVAGGFVFVNVSNPVKNNIPIFQNTIKTTKENPGEHGFGLYSLKKAAKKYNGTMKLACTNCVFSVALELEVPA